MSTRDGKSCWPWIALSAVVSLVLVACGGGGSAPAATYTVGVTVSGLTGSGLTLQINGADDLAVAADGTVTFSTPLASGAQYTVTVSAQPTSPSQTCSVANASGTIGSANVTDAAVTCVTNSYTIGVSVAGLTGTGLVLQVNGGDDLAITKNGAAVFSTALDSGTKYQVTVSTPPSSPAQACTVANASGTVGAVNVSNITVTCSNAYTVSAAVSGLTGSGLVLQLNGGSPLDVIGNGSVVFPSALASGTTYSVSVATQPNSPMQTCAVNNGSGTIGSANVTNVTVTCVLSYTIEVNVNGLSGSGLKLQLNGGDDLSIAPAASTIAASVVATFSGGLVTGTSYTVTVKTQPSLPSQTCTVSNGTGVVASANVTQIGVSCPQIYDPSLTNAWTWFIGFETPGIQGTPAPGFGPSARTGSATWVDTAGNLWLFGGLTFDFLYATAATGNDLLKYSPSTGLWTWVSGSIVPGAGYGVWGTKGVPAAANIPSGRHGAAFWTDTAGNFWLFGGEGTDSTGSGGGTLNDLWEYTPSTGFWTWVGGSNVAGASGVYGTKGVASTNNVPGARNPAATWTDANGNLWLFGGQLQAESLNDLWKYNPAGTTWTWVGGSNNVANSAGIYGIKDMASAGNFPGARSSANSWTDKNGNLWLFGGNGYDSAGNANELNDLWRYDPVAGTWTWVGGSNVGGAHGIYGTEGMASASNVPGARRGANSWTDSVGNTWLFGGYGFDAVGTASWQGAGTWLNDLWKFNPTAGTWTWVRGSNIGNDMSVFGTSGLASTSNMPGAQESGSSWIDAADNLWMFGGIPGTGGPTLGPIYLGAMWVYRPAAP